MIAAQERANDLLTAIFEAMKERPSMPPTLPDETVLSLGNDLGNDFPSSQAVAVPSKMQLALEWLHDHPEDRQLAGRDLERLREPMGIKISYRTWNDAKKQI